MMITAIHFFIIGSIAWFVFKTYGIEYPRVFWLGFFFKISMGAALGLVYLYYYSANDTWLFFKDANLLAALGKSDFKDYLRFLAIGEAPDYWVNHLSNSQDRSLFLIKIMSAFSWMDGNNYWISATYFSLISFLAAWYLFSVITQYFENSWLAASLSFLFFPSVAFWSSGLIKETLALASMYIISGLFLKLINNKKSIWSEWLCAICGFWVAWSLKYYWAALFGAVIFTYLLVHFFTNKILLVKQHKIVVWIITFISLSALVTFLHPNFHLTRFLTVLITNHNDFVNLSDENGLIHFYQFQANWGSVIINAPWALLSGLLRPFIWEARGLTVCLAALENIVISILLITALSRINRVNSYRLLLLSIVTYIILLCVFLALSTPNLGSLSRYRVGFLPFLIFLITYRNPLIGYIQDRVPFLR